MSTTETALLGMCVLPGCTTLVGQAGEVCDGCRAAFGPMLVETDRPALSEARITERDRAVVAAYVDQQRVRKSASEQTEREVKSNQLCWLCEERRRCTRVAGQWECSSCQVASPPGTGGA